MNVMPDIADLAETVDAERVERWRERTRIAVIDDDGNVHVDTRNLYAMEDPDAR